MSRILSMILLLPLLLLISSGSAGQAASSSQPAMPAVYGPNTQFWRTGFFIKRLPSYFNLSLRNPAPLATFRSYDGEQDIFFVLGAAARLLRVAEVKTFLVDCSGSYPGTATLEVAAISMGGLYDHMLSASSLNAQSVSTGSWRNLSLSATPANLRLSAGQALVIFFHLDGAPGGNLLVNAIFQAAVTGDAYELYLPAIQKE